MSVILATTPLICCTLAARLLLCAGKEQGCIPSSEHTHNTTN